MNISEKLIRAKTDLDEAYDAGKNSIIKLHPETTVNGNYISVDDVSELPHNVVCQLSSDTLTDFSGVRVTVCGKNLLDESVIKKIVAAADGRTMNGWEFSGLVGTFTLSVGANWLSSAPLAYKVISADGVFGNWFTLDGRETHCKSRITLNEGEKLIVYLYSNETEPNDTFQLEAGEHMTQHEPYNGEIYTPEIDGTVVGITSVSPYMNIYTDNTDVNLDVLYRMSWGMQEERTRFYDDFRQGKINVSISFAWLALDKASITSVVDALSTTATGQTLALNLNAVNTAFETSEGTADGSASEEFAALVATKPNWTISMI